jgi:hypothetical protein
MRGPKDWDPKRDKGGPDARAEKFQNAVRKAFVEVYGPPRDYGIVPRSIRSSYLEEGRRLGWTKADPSAVLVLTEFGWVEDPWSDVGDSYKQWEKVIQVLKREGWKKPWWDSINPAVHVVYID